jgi:RNA 3'-terminal phosphate cyclase (ATP)
VPAELPILLDGASGEGGGQLLRTALSLAAVTGRAFTIHRLRAHRPKPGLRPQHREAARAVARLCGGELTGDELGSSRLELRPGARVSPSDLVLDIGTAGSTPLLLQTLCWPLALAGGPSTLTLRGGTHQDHAPSFHYLALVWAPAVARLGFKVELSLQAAGFWPEGGGELSARIEPARPMPPLDLRHRGTLREVEVISMVGGLEHDVADRQARQALLALRTAGVVAEVERLPVPVRGSRGSHVLVVATFDRTRSGHGAIGGREAGPEQTAERAVAGFRDHLEGRGAVDKHLGDQLLLPAALLAAGLVPGPPGVVPATRYTVGEVTGHLLANAEVIRRFLDVEVAVLGREGEPGEVRVQPPGAGLEVLPLPHDEGGR